MIIKANPDKEFSADLREKIRKNDGYCLCAIEKSPDTKCICKNFLEETKSGYCNCGLYYKENE